jgi:diadenosine tetraphosphate (Ap4A) HIT family hydrolase/HKD family nuclease
MTDPRPCPFCPPPGDRIAFEEALVFGLWDAFPANPGHLLLVTRRHIPTWFEATQEEQQALTKAIDKARQAIEQRYQPDGFNIGINVKEAAGQTVPHLHVHVIPRYRADVPDPRGGVRHVIPGQGNYLDNASLPTKPEDQRSRLVKGGDDDPLLPSLAEHLAEAHYADLAVGFVLPSGLDRLESHLADLLARGGRLRLVTGDYLDITDPAALTRLLDLDGDREIRVFQTQRDPGPRLPAPLPPLTFHPKAYLFRRKDGTGVAFVGSSNLSAPALTTGLEWNYRVVSSREGGAFEDVLRAFEQLFAHRATRKLDEEWIAAYRRRRKPPSRGTQQVEPQDIEPEPEDPPKPHAVQNEALAKLEATRTEGYEAGLVVLATGLGKTWLSAFDSTRGQSRAREVAVKDAAAVRGA